MYNMIDDFRKLSPPSANLVAMRESKIKRIIEQLGNKYLLAVPVKKLTRSKK